METPRVRYISHASNRRYRFHNSRIVTVHDFTPLIDLTLIVTQSTTREIADYITVNGMIIVLLTLFDQYQKLL